jgi:hypothetical protein
MLATFSSHSYLRQWQPVDKNVPFVFEHSLELSINRAAQVKISIDDIESVEIFPPTFWVSSILATQGAREEDRGRGFTFVLKIRFMAAIGAHRNLGR